MNRSAPLRLADYLRHVLEAIGEARHNVLQRHTDVAEAHAIVWQTIRQDLPGLKLGVAHAADA